MYNIIFHSSTKLTPYEVVYGVPPTKLWTYVLRLTSNQVVDEFLKAKDYIMATLKTNLMVAMGERSYNMVEEFAMSDLVYRRLQLYDKIFDS